MTLTFADSFYFLALYNVRDATHGAALKASASLRGGLLTTDWVLTETADALCGVSNKRGCIALIEDLRRSTRVEIVPASRQTLDGGWALYRDRADKD